VNLTGPLNCLEAVLPTLLAQPARHRAGPSVAGLPRPAAGADLRTEQGRADPLAGGCTSTCTGNGNRASTLVNPGFVERR